MSRGPGVWQRVILQAVADGQWHRLTALLPPVHSRSEVNALNRAAHQLAAAGRVRVFRYCDSRATEVGPAGQLRSLRKEMCGPCPPGGAWYPCPYTRELSVGRCTKATSNTYGTGGAS